MAMLEAFVHDPLINWRLLNTTAPGENANEYTGAGVMTMSAVHTSSNAPTPAATPGPGDKGSSKARLPARTPRSPRRMPRRRRRRSRARTFRKRAEGTGLGTGRRDDDAAAGDRPGDGGPGRRRSGEDPVTHTDTHNDHEETTTPVSDGASESDPEPRIGRRPPRWRPRRCTRRRPSSTRAGHGAGRRGGPKRGRERGSERPRGERDAAHEPQAHRAGRRARLGHRRRRRRPRRKAFPGAESRAGAAAGEDVENAAPDGIDAQVQRLIVAATSHENLCQSYIGWCPFW